MTLDTASGTLIPAARKVKPMIESGILKVSPEMQTQRNDMVQLFQF